MIAVVGEGCMNIAFLSYVWQIVGQNLLVSNFLLRYFKGINILLGGVCHYKFRLTTTLHSLIMPTLQLVPGTCHKTMIWHSAQNLFSTSSRKSGIV